MYIKERLKVDKETQKKLEDIESKIYLGTDIIRVISELTQKAYIDKNLPTQYCYCIFELLKEKSEQVLKQCEKLDLLLLRTMKIPDKSE